MTIVKKIKYSSTKRYSLLFIFLVHSVICFAQREIPLYQGLIPNSKKTLDDKFNSDKSVYYRVVNPSLHIYLPDKNIATTAAIIICAGGGYAELNIKREGYDIAQVFSKIGVAAFVLKYRLPNDNLNKNKMMAPLQDAQQAIKLVRDSAARWNIDPTKIGIMGFSAGGHLASSAAVHYNDVLIDNPSKTSVRPDFMILVYPVISFGNSYGHIGSRDNLIGKKPSPALVKYFSNELHVTKKTPPGILIASGDDNIVSVINSVKFYESLQKNNVNAELHIYAKGGHGFGVMPTVDEWFGRCINWLRASRFIK